MSMLFPYRMGRSPKPVITLGGQVQRPKAIIDVALLGPTKTILRQSLLDTGADDTVFSLSVANQAGIDLTGAPTMTCAGVGGLPYTVSYVQVPLRISDGKEFREWQAWVGFTSASMNRPLMGYAGFLQFFTATFYGDRKQVELAINADYPGT